MKPIYLLAAVFSFARLTHAQQGLLSLNDMLSLSKAPVNTAAGQITGQHGFEFRMQDIAEGNTAETSDSTIYFIWYAEDGITNNRIMFNSKIKNGVSANLISFTTTDEKWFESIKKSLSAPEFTLTDIKILSDDAHDAAVYEQGNYRITVLWSYMGSETKYYVVDVNWFEK